MRLVYPRNMETRTRRQLAALAAIVTSVACQPQDETPGLWLHGEIALERVGDWSFSDDIEEVFIETRPWYALPHSTTIWCATIDGELYIGSYGDQKKAWEENVARNPEAKLNIAGKLYEVTVEPVTDPDRTEVLDGVYAQKYDMAEVFGDELPRWWYYQVTQRRTASR
jgi:hypothetical protein